LKVTQNVERVLIKEKQNIMTIEQCKDVTMTHPKGINQAAVQTFKDNSETAPRKGASSTRSCGLKMTKAIKKVKAKSSYITTCMY